MKLVKESIYDKGINLIEQDYDRRKPGFYLAKTTPEYGEVDHFGGEASYIDLNNEPTFISYQANDHDELHDHLEKLIGPWSSSNEEWEKYVVIEVFADGEEDAFRY